MKAFLAQKPNGTHESVRRDPFGVDVVEFDDQIVWLLYAR